MRVYCASKSCHHEWWAALREAGIDIVSTWDSWPPNFDDSIVPTADQWSDHVQRCCAEIAACDVLLLYVRAGEQHLGAILEAGCALGCGKRIFAVAPYQWEFLRNHRLCRSFNSLKEAIAAIVAGSLGERERARAA
jgi:hypothetical protein